MKARRSGLVAAVVSLAFAGSTFGRSAEADVAADAKVLFVRARTLRLQGDCSNAVPIFRKAHETYPVALGSLRNLAECEETLGDFASAKSDWLILRHALRTNGNPNYEGWEEDADRGAERAAAKLARLTVDVVPPKGDAETRTDEARRTAGWIGVGAGGVAWIGAAVALAVRQSASDDLAQECPAGRCAPSHRDAVQAIEDRGHAASALASLLGVAGLVGAGGGIVLLLTSGRHSPANAAALAVSPAGVSVAGRF